MSGMPQDAPPTPEELNAIGYQPPQATTQQPEAPPTPEELAAIGYTQPKVEPTKPDHSSLLADAGDAIIGELGSIGGSIIKNVGKIAGSKTLSDFGQSRQSMGDYLVNEAKNSSPITAEIAKLGVDTVGALASTTTSLPGLVAGGAASALASSNSDSPGSDVLVGGALGVGVGATGKILSTLSPVAQKILSGAQLNLRDPAKLADNAMDIVLSKVGGNITSVTPKDLAQAIQSTEASAKLTKNALYAARDAQATAEGVGVTRNNLQSVVQELQSSVLAGATKDTRSAALEGKKLLGNGAELSFGEAQKLVSSIGQSANSAAASGNLARASQLGSMRDALLKDINESAASPSLMATQGAANNYYASVYRPIRDLQVGKILADKVTQDQFLAKFANKVIDSPKAMQALGTADENTARMAVLSNVNAIKAASANGVTGAFDLTKFSNALGNEIKNNGPAYGEQASRLQALAQVLQASVQAHSGVSASQGTKLLQVASGIGGYLVGGLPGLASAAAINKAGFLYSAGKLIDNPEAQELLKQAVNLQKYPSADIVPLVHDKIVSLFSNQLRNIPTRLAPAFGVSLIDGN